MRRSISYIVPHFVGHFMGRFVPSGPEGEQAIDKVGVPESLTGVRDPERVWGRSADFTPQRGRVRTHCCGLKSALRGAQHGFTLIELMVVIALVGIAAVMIVPEMKGSYEDAVLRSASRELLNVCQLAYSRAVSHNQVHRVRIDEASGRYLIEVLSGGAGREPQFRPVKEMRDSKGEIDPRITVRVRTPGDTEAKSFPGSSGDQESTEPGLLVFYGDGTADSREVWLQGGHGFGIVLSVNPVTARVRVSELARR